MAAGDQGSDDARRAPDPERRDGAARRAAILEAAVRLFAEHGYAASFDDIARASGVTRTVLYYYFPSKRALFVAAYEQQASAFVEAVGPALGGSGRARVRSLVDAGFAFAEEHPHAWPLLARWSDGVDPEVADVVATTRSMIKSVASGLLADPLEAAGIDLSTPEGDAAFDLIMLGFAAAVARWRRSPSQDREAIVALVSILVTRMTSSDAVDRRV
jgi:AcrR family transcriptional regulator